jgi:hypothetical protein
LRSAKARYHVLTNAGFLHLSQCRLVPLR